MRDDEGAGRDDGERSDAPRSDTAGGSPRPTGSGPDVGDGGPVARDQPAGPQGTPRSEKDGGEYGWAIYLYDLVSSVAVVAIVGGLLFAASGVWPPMVAVESGSMEPTMEKGDLVYVMEEDRFPGEGAHGDTGVVTAERGRETGYRSFGGYGDVIVFQPDGSERQTPIIHRAMLWVEEGERWADRANPAYLGGADGCDDLPDDVCPAPHAGFITKGDDNGGYDQVSGIADSPVKPEWVIGTAELHVPYLGQIRLGSAGIAAGADRAGAVNIAGNGSATIGGNGSIPIVTPIGSDRNTTDQTAPEWNATIQGNVTVRGSATAVRPTP